MVMIFPDSYDSQPTTEQIANGHCDTDWKALLEKTQVTVRVGYGPSWELAQRLQDIAERIGVELVGGSSEQGQSFYRCRGFKIGQFRKACTDAGFVAT